jgi:DNA-binding NarL/FixJ family response regulator
LSNKEIASRLGIEVATVKKHVHNLLDEQAIGSCALVAVRRSRK